MSPRVVRLARLTPESMTPDPKPGASPPLSPLTADSLALHLLTGKNPEPHLDLQCLWICLCVTISMTVPLQVASGQPHRGRSAPLVPSFHMAASVALVEVLLYMSPMHQCSCPPTDSKRSLDTPWSCLRPQGCSGCPASHPHPTHSQGLHPPSSQALLG